MSPLFLSQSYSILLVFNDWLGEFWIFDSKVALTAVANIKIKKSRLNVREDTGLSAPQLRYSDIFIHM